jgi:hypothetical protein
MAAPKVYPKTCQKCGGFYRGNKLQRLCDPCKVQDGRDCSADKLIERTCQGCGEMFLGHKIAKRCVPCQAKHMREYNLNRKKVDYQARKAIAAGLNRPNLPPPCSRCHYCHETEAYPSGMVCLAEAFMRCQPWNMGAKPLKEKENV